MSKKFPPLKSKDVVKVLKRLDYQECEQKGSHRHFEKEGCPKITVPEHNKEIAKGTLLAIIADTGLTRSAFYALL